MKLSPKNIEDLERLLKYNYYDEKNDFFDLLDWDGLTDEDTTEDDLNQHANENEDHIFGCIYRLLQALQDHKEKAMK